MFHRIYVMSTNHWPLFIAVSILVITLFVLLVRFLKRRKQRKQHEVIWKQKQKEEQLTERLRNKYAKDQRKWQTGDKPYDSAYKEPEETASGRKIQTKQGIRLELEVQSSEWTQKYMVLVSSDYIIGSTQGCNLVLKGRKVSKRHCRLFASKGRLYAADLKSEGGTWLIRGPKTMRLFSEPYEVNHRDILQAGDIRIRIHKL